MDEIPDSIIEANASYRAQAKMYLHEFGSREDVSPQYLQTLHDVNVMTEKVCDFVKEKTSRFMELGKFVGVIGGEHSTPLGYMQALAEKYEYGILQFDAHADLRTAYEGFTHSHASIMYNACKLDRITK